VIQQDVLDVVSAHLVEHQWAQLVAEDVAVLFHASEQETQRTRRDRAMSP
jgi:hypothetical protein